MLDQLIESKSNAKENRTRGGFLLTTFLVMVGICFSAVLSSLFAMNLGIGDEEFELSSLVAPIVPIETKPEPVKKEETQTQKTVSDVPTRQTNMLRLNENPLVPTEISTVPNTQKARPNSYFKLAPGTERDTTVPQGAFNRESNENGNGIVQNESRVIENNEKEEEPVLQKKVVAEKTVTTKRVSGGVVNGQATSLPKPTYPPAAKIVKAQGEVSVQVLIDKSGNVVSAKAVSGHALLRAEAEKAARNAKFKPTRLTGEPVEVTGIIIYKFALQ